MKSLLFLGLINLLLFGCQPEASSSNQNDVLAAQLIDLGQKNYKQTRALPFFNDATIGYCEVSLTGSAGATSPKLYSGFNDKKLLPIASLSKLLVTAFALDRVGPHFKFKHILKIKKNAEQNSADFKTSYDIFLDTGFDPIVNIEKLLYIMAKLNERGVSRLRTLYISSSSRVYLSVLNSPHLELTEVPVSLDQSIENLKLIMNSKNWGPQTQAAAKNVTHYLDMKKSNLRLAQEFSVQNVAKAPEDFSFDEDETVIIPSVPMSRYLKEINVNSSNYISDALFNYLGDRVEFLNFQKKRLQLDSSELVINTGSGLPMVINGQRQDNKATCRAMLKVLHYIQMKSQQVQVNLDDLLLVAGSDQGTYESDLYFDGSVVLKTGRLYEIPTLNLAGLASTQKGLIGFVFLGNNFANSDEDVMKNKRDDFLFTLMSTYLIKPAYKSSPSNAIYF